MTWTNAFDLGTCTIKVGNDVTPDAYFSGVLAKGDTSATFTGFLGETLQVSVSAAGDVALNYISGSGPADNYTLYVDPSYSITGKSIRAGGFNIPNGVSGGHGAAAWSSDGGNVYVNLTGADQAWAPDPADLTEAGFQAYWCVYQGHAVA